MKIAGPGRVRVSRDGIEVDGFQADARAKIEAALVLLFIAAFAGLIMFAAGAIFSRVPALFVHMAGGGLGGLLYFMVIAGRDKHLADKPVQLTIPWTSVGEVARDLRNPGGLVVEVKGQSALETLHFHPADGPDELYFALRDRPLIGG